MGEVQEEQSNMAASPSHRIYYLYYTVGRY